LEPAPSFLLARHDRDTNPPHESDPSETARFLPPLPIPILDTRWELGAILEKETKQSGAELGVQVGLFAESVLKIWPSCTKFYLVDLWSKQVNYEDYANVVQEQQESNFKQAMRRLAPWSSKTMFLRMSTNEATQHVANNSLDFVYVDARHDYCAAREDLENWWPKLKIGGIMAGDDFLTAADSKLSGQHWGKCADGTIHPGAVRGAVEEFAEANRLQIVLTKVEPTRTWMLRKYRP
jgi:hypothetical protein